MLVQDAATGEPIPEARVTFRLTPRDRPGQTIRHAATSEAATNKLLKAAVFELPEPGRWEVEVAIEGGQGSARVRFELEAAETTPQWPAMWPWIGWPAPVILLFSIHQLLVWRKSPTGTESPSQSWIRGRCPPYLRSSSHRFTLR